MRFWIGPTWRTILPTSANYYVGTKWVCGLKIMRALNASRTTICGVTSPKNEWPIRVISHKIKVR